jgi:hypothetical protein
MLSGIDDRALVHDQQLAEEEVDCLSSSDPADRFNPLLLRLPWPPAGVDRRGSALLLSLANCATAVG